MNERGENTQFKLDEAKFFLDQLRPNYNKQRKFDFFLSAFISAARSVTWVMRAEYAEVPGWIDWFDARTPSKEEAALLKGTNAVRVRAQKSRPLQTVSNFAIDGIQISPEDAPRVFRAIDQSPTGTIPARVGGTKGNYYVEFDAGDESLRCPVESLLIERNLEEFPGQDILSVCNAYYSALETLVRECHAKFDA